MNLSGKQALGMFFAGAAAGAVFALLYAPKSGERTRKDLRRFTRRTVDRLDDFQTGVRDQVGGLVNEGRSRIEKILT